MAIFLIEVGFPCDKVYRQAVFVPCHNCKTCATDDPDFCDNGDNQTVDLSPEYICKEYKYTDVIKAIQGSKSLQCSKLFART